MSGHNPRIINAQNRTDIIKEMKEIGVSPAGIEVMFPKTIHIVMKLEKVEIKAALILKQNMLSVGGDVALSQDVIPLKCRETDLLLIGTLKQYRAIIERLKNQCFGLPNIGEEIEKTLTNYMTNTWSIKCGRYTLELGKRTHIMGVLNVTPDSFSDGGLYMDPEKAVDRAWEMVAEGADIVDIGGESTRPGSIPCSAEEELRRIKPVIERLAKTLSVPISVDTYKSEVAEVCLDLGASMINDISGLRFDPKMKEVIAKYKCPVVIMHIKGKPKDMQKNPFYDSLISEIMAYLREGIEIARSAGIEDVIIDPGIGFGKTTQHNLEILARLSEFRSLGRPILIGTSRKSLIGNVLNLPIDKRTEGTLTTIALAIANGASVVRVHDVKEVLKVAKMSDAIIQSIN